MRSGLRSWSAPHSPYICIRKPKTDHTRRTNNQGKSTTQEASAAPQHRTNVDTATRKSHGTQTAESSQGPPVCAFSNFVFPMKRLGKQYPPCGASLGWSNGHGPQRRISQHPHSANSPSVCTRERSCERLSCWRVAEEIVSRGSTTERDDLPGLLRSNDIAQNYMTKSASTLDLHCEVEAAALEELPDGMESTSATELRDCPRLVSASLPKAQASPERLYG
jgi:hypothetical protein